jgi:Bifunctional DNA primase/polymerase, N-terminal/Primase C terminal 2 (PriCT-2)
MTRAPGPFAGYAATYRRLGYAPIPVKPGTKQPLISDWPRWCDELPAPELVKQWMERYPDSGIAIATGPASGIVALDLDHDDGTHAAILAAAGPSPVGKRGARGATYFYRYSDEKSQAFRRNGDTVCEILAGKRLVIIPPTVHPDTRRPYEWITPERLINRPASSLPPLNAAGVAALFEEPARKPQRPRPASPRPPARSGSAAAEMIAEALSHIPADLGYADWIRIGMALKAALGEAGFQLFDAWSSTATAKYDARQTQAKWDSFEPTSISAGTIFHLAGRNGWQRPRSQRHQR